MCVLCVCCVVLAWCWCGVGVVVVLLLCCCCCVVVVCWLCVGCVVVVWWLCGGCVVVVCCLCVVCVLFVCCCVLLCVVVCCCVVLCGVGGSDDSPHGVSVQARADYAPNWVAEHLGASSRRPRHPFPALMVGEPLAVYLCTRPKKDPSTITAPVAEQQQACEAQRRHRPPCQCTANPA